MPTVADMAGCHEEHHTLPSESQAGPRCGGSCLGLGEEGMGNLERRVGLGCWEGTASTRRVESTPNIRKVTRFLSRDLLACFTPLCNAICSTICSTSYYTCNDVVVNNNTVHERRRD